MAASTTAITTSGRSRTMKSRAIRSSSEFAVRLYVPGKSIKVNALSPCEQSPDLRSTVLPGQLPTC